MSTTQSTTIENGFPPSFPLKEGRKGISSSVLGVLIFVAAELMFFAALFSAHSIISSSAAEWPPLDQTRLPVMATAINSLFLIASAVTIYLAHKAFKVEAFGSKSRNLLLVSIALGSLFVGLQGAEWVSLIAQGFTLKSTIYSSFFYLIIGTHGVHALGAIFALLRMLYKFHNRSLDLESFTAHSIFWYFVVGIWPVLYVTVYL